MSALAKHLLLVCRAGLPCVGFGYVRSFVELFGGLPCVGFSYTFARVSSRFAVCRLMLNICSFIELIGSCRVLALAKFARMSSLHWLFAVCPLVRSCV